MALRALFVQAATTFTGDRIQGLPVITQLDVDDLEPRNTHRFMFQGAENIVTILASNTDCPADGCPYHGDEE